MFFPSTLPHVTNDGLGVVISTFCVLASLSGTTASISFVSGFPPTLVVLVDTLGGITLSKFEAGVVVCSRSVVVFVVVASVEGIFTNVGEEEGFGVVFVVGLDGFVGDFVEIGFLVVVSFEKGFGVVLLGFTEGLDVVGLVTFVGFGVDNGLVGLGLGVGLELGLDDGFVMLKTGLSVGLVVGSFVEGLGVALVFSVVDLRVVEDTKVIGEVVSSLTMLSTL